MGLNEQQEGFAATTMVNGVSYNTAGQWTAMSYGGYAETRQYNQLGQLTQITAVQGSQTVVNLTYQYGGTNKVVAEIAARRIRPHRTQPVQHHPLPLRLHQLAREVHVRMGWRTHRVKIGTRMDADIQKLLNITVEGINTSNIS